MLIKPTYKVKTDIRDGQPLFDLFLKLDATVDQLNENIDIEQLQRMGEEVVRDEIMRSFRNGIAKRVDVLKLEETFYRDRPKQWHELRKNNKPMLSQESIRKIVVKINIRNTGKYKGRFH